MAIAETTITGPDEAVNADRCLRAIVLDFTALIPFDRAGETATVREEISVIETRWPDGTSDAGFPTGADRVAGV